MAQGDIFGGDPFTGQGVFQSSSGGRVDMDLAAAFGGRFYVSGGYLVDTLDPSGSLSLGQQGPFTMQDVGNNRYALISRIDVKNINRPTSDQVLRTVEATINVFLSDGTLEPLVMDSVAVNQIGFQALAYPRDDGSTGITHVRGIFANNAEVQAALGPLYRLATPTETIQAALARKLYVDNQEAIKRIGEDRNLTDPTGNVDLSGTVRALMEEIPLEYVQAASNWLFE